MISLRVKKAKHCGCFPAGMEHASTPQTPHCMKADFEEEYKSYSLKAESQGILALGSVAPDLEQSHIERVLHPWELSIHAYICKTWWGETGGFGVKTGLPSLVCHLPSGLCVESLRSLLLFFCVRPQRAGICSKRAPFFQFLLLQLMLYILRRMISPVTSWIKCLKKILHCP